jgi:uncharacterized protein (DUF1810 family)
MSDPYDLERFVSAQRQTFEQALAELNAGQKRSHWMWFIFPQLAGLGQSEMAWRYGISNLGEARAYWQHDVLGPRLRDCMQAVLPHAGRGVRQIFGTPDDLKLCSCLTLFKEAAPDEPVFQKMLDAFFGGKTDSRTLSRLRAVV